jgi:serine/threonine-protein kinase RsbW
VPRFRTEIAALAREAGAPQQVQDDVKLAVTEACANVVVHAYTHGQPAGDLRVSASVDGPLLLVTVRDWGIGVSADSSASGLGLGLVLLRTLTDSVDIVSHPDDGVEVRMAFDLAAGDTD